MSNTSLALVPKNDFKAVASPPALKENPKPNELATIKATIRDCWAASDNQASFQQSLKEQGYILAQGYRSFVVVDQSCEIYAVPKWLGLRVKKE